MARLILGLDSSTQSMSAVVIDIDSREIVAEAALNFSQRFPEYNTVDGVLRDVDPAVVHAPPLMWVAALDALLLQLSAQVRLNQVVAIGGSGQQHGSVYLKSSFNQCLSKLDPAVDLALQIKDQFSRATSPIWMDSSTSSECTELAQACGGNEALCHATGSIAVERFTGAQIKKFSKADPVAYAETQNISLVSSFMASLLHGKVVGIDYGDASGMNLFSLRERQWFQPAIKHCGADLEKKLGPALDPRLAVGAVSAYLVQRYGFAESCQVLPFSGDNPCSLIGLGLVDDGMTAISLGTSDTVFGHMTALPEQMSAWAHTFIAPTNHYMLLLCFKNGSLAREAVRKKFSLSWDEFTAAIESTSPGNNGGFMLPWFDSEIVPKVLRSGVQQFNLDEKNAAAQCRAVVESQMLAMRLHAEEAGLYPMSIRATGGASENRAILQIMADVFQCPVDVLRISNGAALGAALRAAQTFTGASWDEAVADFSAVESTRRVMPRSACAGIYQQMLQAYAAAEAKALSTL